jgi:hypothetical protein
MDDLEKMLAKLLQDARKLPPGQKRHELLEPPRVCRRLFGLSYAAMAGCSSMA